MEHSDSIAKVSAALVQAQSDLSNPTNNTKNAFLGNSYFPLPDLIEHVKGTLQSYGLTVVQLPTGSGGEVGITTTILHESGEWLSNTVTMPVEPRKGNTLAQVAGGTITYLRRYSIAAALGIASEDDDGNHGVDPRRAEPTRKDSPKQEYIDYSRMNPRDMTAKQLAGAIKQEAGDNEDWIESARQAWEEKDKGRMATLLEEIRAKANGATTDEELF